MAEGARVQDVAALIEFQTFLGRLRENLGNRCDEVKVEFQRVSGWLDGEAQSYWRTARSRAEHRFSEARDALSLCRAKVREDDHESCSEQKRQFEKTKARLALCEQRLKELKACQLQWEQFSLQALPRLAEATDLVETHLPRARTELARILTILEQYQEG